VVIEQDPALCVPQILDNKRRDVVIPIRSVHEA
jgi:hypothetical protein